MPRLRRRSSIAHGIRSRARANTLARFALVSMTLACTEGTARAQACCAGASGLTPGWLTNHETALVGAQLRLSETHGTYPTSGSFYTALPERDTRVETSLFASFRFLPRGQLSVLAPLDLTRRRSGGVVEERVAPGDATVTGRYDLIRAGESRIPGIALLAGMQIPLGPAPDQSTGLLGANVTGIGAFEFDLGGSVEQVFGHVVLHATVLGGYRSAREVLGIEQHLGLHALYLVAGGWVFDDDTSILATVTHISEGDATVRGAVAPGTGYRTTQVALLVIAPLTDTLRLRASFFSDLPPFGVNRPALGGTAISFVKSWL